MLAVANRPSSSSFCLNFRFYGLLTRAYSRVRHFSTTMQRSRFRTALKALLASSLKGSLDAQQNVLDIITKKDPEVAWKFFKKNYDTYLKVGALR